MPILKWMVVLMVALPFVQLKAQDAAGKTVKHELASKATGQEYEVFVSLPKNYAANDTARYPVLYVLDGNFMFPIMYETHRLLSEVEEVRDIIIVGIGYHTSSILESMQYRTPDYTPTKDTAFEQMLTRELKLNIRSGGADRFLQVLKQDIFPFVEKKYRTGNRGLAGHSFGALFGTYVLLHEPALFNKYLLSSISMPWDNQVMLKQEQSFFQAGNRAVNAQVFVTVGAQEEAFDMIPAMKKLTTAMRSRNYQGLVLEERVLPNESHASAFLTAFNQGLRVLYKK